MQHNSGPITPDQQRAFERARRAAMALCPGHERRLGHIRDTSSLQVEAANVERVRWLVVAMGTARGTPGGAAIASLARHGYAVAMTSVFTKGRAEAVPFDRAGLVFLGEPLPAHGRSWSSIERRAMGIDISLLPRVCPVSAHLSLRIIAELRAQGHAFE